MMLRRELKDRLEAVRPRLYRLAWSWCHDHDLADELTQGAYAKALTRIGSLRDEEKLESWMCSILANHWKDHLRRRKPQAEEDPDELPDSPSGYGGDPETDAHSHEIVRQVRHAIARLGPEQRMVITLVDLMDMSYADVARVLDIPAGTVMSRLSRARAKLKTYLEATESTSNEPGQKVIPIRSRS